TPHIALFILEKREALSKENTFRKEVISAMADFLHRSPYGFFKLDFDPMWNDMQPMIWKGLETEVRYTYRLDLLQSIPELLSHMDGKTRNMITRAQKENLVISH